MLNVLRESRVTCVIVTHDAEEAMLLADRVALMRAGRLVQQGEPRTLYREPVDLFAARFFCELNAVPARVHDGVAVTPVGRFPAPRSGRRKRRRGGDPAAGHLAASGRDRGRGEALIPAAFSARLSSLPSRLTDSRNH